MQLRITGGELRGRLIKTLPTLRPAMEKVRKAVFDVLGPIVSGSSFLELYAGSGSVGMEAISRGANQVTFVEADRKHADLIKSNLKALGIADTAAIRAMTVEAFIPMNPHTFDIVFADPWYEEDIDMTGWEKLLAPGGVLVLEHASAKPSPQPDHFKLINEKVYGDTALAFYIRQ